MRIRITKEDMSLGKVLPPGKYRLRINGLTVEPTKKGDSDNFVGDYTVVGGEHDGTSLRNWMNEKKKQPGRKLLGRLFLACGYKEDKNGDIDAEIEKVVGREVEAYITNRLYEGNMQNQIEDFLPVEKAATA